jgi:hypothetical protein
LLALPFIFVSVLYGVGLLLAGAAVVLGVRSRHPSAPIPGVIGVMLGGFELAYFVFGVLEVFEDFQDWSY